MKRILFAVFAIAAIFVAVSAEGKTIKGSGVTAEKTIVFASDYREVSVSLGIKVVLSPDLTDHAELVADEAIMEYLTVTSSGGRVKVAYSSGVVIKTKIETVVTLPMSTVISVVNVSSSAKLRAEEINTTRPIAIRLSSSGSVQTNIVAPSAEINGTSSARYKGDITANKVLIDLSSSSKYEGRVVTDKLSVDASSASRCTVEGNCDELDVDISSASGFDGLGLQASKVTVDASSAAKANVWATNELAVDLSSASSVHYKGSPTFTATDISSGASLKKIEE